MININYIYSEKNKGKFKLLTVILSVNKKPLQIRFAESLTFYFIHFNCNYYR